VFSCSMSSAFGGLVFNGINLCRLTFIPISKTQNSISISNVMVYVLLLLGEVYNR